MSATETKGTALITGASGGIGAIYADRLDRLGYYLILIALECCPGPPTQHQAAPISRSMT